MLRNAVPGDRAVFGARPFQRFGLHRQIGLHDPEHAAGAGRVVGAGGHHPDGAGDGPERGGAEQLLERAAAGAVRLADVHDADDRDTGPLGEFAQRRQGVAHVPLGVAVRPRHEARHRVDDRHVDAVLADRRLQQGQMVGQVEQPVATIRLAHGFDGEDLRRVGPVGVQAGPKRVVQRVLGQ